MLSTSASLGNRLSFPPPIRAICPCRVMLCNTIDLLLSVVFSGRSKSSQRKGQLQRWGCQPNITWPICLFFPRRSEDHDILSAQTISRKMVWLKIIISLLERQRQILPSKFYSKNVIPFSFTTKVSTLKLELVNTLCFIGNPCLPLPTHPCKAMSCNTIDALLSVQSSVAQGSHFSGLTKFPDFSSIFSHFPVFFQ